MRKVISSINVTLDGFCDHTALIADGDLHKYANDLLDTADVVLFGRVTYQLFEAYWPDVARNGTDIGALNEFAHKIDAAKKIVFSGTLDKVEWNNTLLVKGNIKEVMLDMKRYPGKDMLMFGSPGLLATFINMGLVDEYQFLIQPIVLGKGRPLFNGNINRLDLKLLKTKAFASGVALHYYEPVQK